MIWIGHWILKRHTDLQFQYANFTNDAYNKSGKGSLRLQLINQRADFAFALFTGGLSAVRLKHVFSIFFCVMYWHWIVWMVFDDDLFCTVIAEADCCLKQSDVWKSKGARLPSAGTREILEWSKFKLWTCFCQCNARVIVVWLPMHVHSSFSLWTSAWLLITW